jgi:hypothetical protein
MRTSTSMPGRGARRLYANSVPLSVQGWSYEGARGRERETQHACEDDPDGSCSYPSWDAPQLSPPWSSLRSGTDPVEMAGLSSQCFVAS